MRFADCTTCARAVSRRHACLGLPPVASSLQVEQRRNHVLHPDQVLISSGFGGYL